MSRYVSTVPTLGDKTIRTEVVGTIDALVVEHIKGGIHLHFCTNEDYKIGVDSDITLIVGPCSDHQRSFLVHRDLLSQVSQRFKKTFNRHPYIVDHPMVILELPEIDSEAMDYLLTVIYFKFFPVKGADQGYEFSSVAEPIWEIAEYLEIPMITTAIRCVLMDMGELREFHGIVWEGEGWLDLLSLIFRPLKPGQWHQEHGLLDVFFSKQWPKEWLEGRLMTDPREDDGPLIDAILTWNLKRKFQKQTRFYAAVAA